MRIYNLNGSVHATIGSKETGDYASSWATASEIRQWASVLRVPCPRHGRVPAVIARAYFDEYFGRSE